MHPYITQALMNERVADMHRRAAASRLARQARRRAGHEARAAGATPQPALPIPAVPRQAGRGTGGRPAVAAGQRRSARGSRKPVGAPGLSGSGRPTACAPATTREAEDSAAGNRALSGSSHGR